MLQGVTKVKKNNKHNKMTLKGNSKFLKYETKNYSTRFSKLTRNDKDMTRNNNIRIIITINFWMYIRFNAGTTKRNDTFHFFYLSLHKHLWIFTYKGNLKGTVYASHDIHVSVSLGL